MSTYLKCTYNTTW